MVLGGTLIEPERRSRPARKAQTAVAVWAFSRLVVDGPRRSTRRGAPLPGECPCGRPPEGSGELPGRRRSSAILRRPNQRSPTPGPPGACPGLVGKHPLHRDPEDDDESWASDFRNSDPRRSRRVSVRYKGVAWSLSQVAMREASTVCSLNSASMKAIA